ncbi:hypothetical protein GM3708_2037 [Geminocystis sp. NIES-3708]|uniref:hypothetical protein n=1 Tax=Geminocystis sp. NIES-3708 TaxID=1615909 RepID=UPI0005FCD3E5|nr:hypothetical protein [Geminocystis sp. NIES-3708]BAQ61631.1 hypothetical protein GM3708_2037 [Geminocystis sp. NIES-3708]
MTAKLFPVRMELSTYKSSVYASRCEELRKALDTMKKLTLFADLELMGGVENYEKLVSASAELKAFLDTQCPF